MKSILYHLHIIDEKLDGREELSEYPFDYQKKIRKIIENLTLEKALENGMSRREFFYLKKKLQNIDRILLKGKILKKLMLNNF